MTADKEHHGPYLVHHWPKDDAEGPQDWSGAQSFENFEDAVHHARYGHPPAGTSPWILSANGLRMDPDDVAGVFLKGG